MSAVASPLQISRRDKTLASIIECFCGPVFSGSSIAGVSRYREACKELRAACNDSHVAQIEPGQAKALIAAIRQFNASMMAHVLSPICTEYQIRGCVMAALKLTHRWAEPYAKRFAASPEIEDEGRHADYCDAMLSSIEALVSLHEHRAEEPGWGSSAISNDKRLMEFLLRPAADATA